MSGCSWPEPELSLGPVCTSLGDLDKYTCWEVRDESPAHQAWRRISRPIIQLLQDQGDDLDAQETDLMIEMFMIGQDPSSATGLFYGIITLYACKQTPLDEDESDDENEFSFFGLEKHDSGAILMLGNSDNALEGRLSSIPTFFRTPGGTVFRELWVVTCTSGKFYNGDCGSWVVDCANGTLYGIVAYGYPGTDTAISLSSLQRSDSARTVRTDKNNHPPPLAPAFLEDPHPGIRRRSWSENSIQSTIFDTRSLNSSNGHFSRIPTHLAQQSNASSSHLSILSNSDRFLSPGSRRPRSSISGSSAPSSHKFRPHSTASTTQSIDSGYLNPPCNNLYVRNLPAEPSEDDLRDLFSTFPGFEGLRMKLNEPECFVQFENVSSAAFALQQTDDHHFSEDDKWGIMVGYARHGVTPADVVPTQDEIELEISISELLSAETLPSMREVGGRIRKLVRPPRIQVGVPHVHKGLKQVSDKSQMLQEMFALESEDRASDKVVITDSDEEG
ncbi:putative cell wall integrity protein scw1 [Halenospora varia]|nr:putative cell wall integrity protein scw1 [Halenospora varia]